MSIWILHTRSILFESSQSGQSYPMEIVRLVNSKSYEHWYLFLYETCLYVYICKTVDVVVMKACLEKKWKRACEIICSSAGLSSPPLRGVEHLGGNKDLSILKLSIYFGTLLSLNLQTMQLPPSFLSSNLVQSPKWIKILFAECQKILLEILWNIWQIGVKVLPSVFIITQIKRSWK